VFLLALAIADDLGAIAVIAIFYTDDIAFEWLAAAVAAFGAVALMGRFGVRDLIPVLAVGLFAWFAIHESGIHATIAGVVLGLLAPTVAFYENRVVQEQVLSLAEGLQQSDTPEGDEIEQSTLRELEELARESQPVSDRLEHTLHPWTSYLIIPIFALANAGVELSGDTIADAARSPIALGVAFGLMFGKPIGILLFSLAAVRLGIATLPAGVSWMMLGGAGMIAGIGFTVSLFISELAFDDAALIDEAKIGILAASAAMGVLGYLTLRTRVPKKTDLEQTMIIDQQEEASRS
jgi:NhaA family Na+:H+ antiporter